MDGMNGQTFSALLRCHRLAAGWTQAELAERSGVSLRAVSDLERGLKQHPRPHTIALLATAMRLSKKETLLLARSVPARAGGRRSQPLISQAVARQAPEADGSAGAVQLTPAP